VREIDDSPEQLPDAAERLVRLGERYLSWPELCRRAGVPHEVADPLWRALGFPDVPPDGPAYTDDDLRALEIAAEGLERLRGDDRRAAIDLIVREARSISVYLAPISEAQVESLPELQRYGLRSQAIEQAFERGIQQSDLGWLLHYGLRRRLDDALRRRATVDPGGQPMLAVGFVEFTSTSSGLDPEDFGALLNRFESLAWDVVTEAGGVKLIGDEAMFVCPAAIEAARAVAEVIGACRRRSLPGAGVRAARGARGRLLRGGGQPREQARRARRSGSGAGGRTISRGRGWVRRAQARARRAEVAQRHRRGARVAPRSHAGRLI
jgi:adenylate cyclase